MSDPVSAPAAPPPASRGRTARHIGRWVWLALVTLLAVGIFAAYRWVDSEAALRYVLGEISARSGGRVQLHDATGSLLSNVHVREIRYQDDKRSVRLEDVDLAWSVRGLIDRTLHVERLAARQLTVVLAPPTDEPIELPESIALPLRVQVDRARVERIDIERGDAHWTIRGLGFAYEGDADGHRLRDLALAADEGTVAGHLQIGAQRPYALSGELVLTGSEALHNPQLRIALGGSVEALELKGDGSIAGASVRASARFTPLAKITLPQFELAASGLDPHAIDAALPSARLNVTITGVGEEGARYSGTFVATNAIPGPIDARRIPVRRIESRYVLTTKSIAASNLVATLANGGTITGSGQLALAPGVPGAAGSAWDLALRKVDLRSIHSKLVTTDLAGTVKAEVTGERQHVVGDVRQQDMGLEFDATIAGTRVELARFRASAGGGEAAGTGRFDWSGQRTFSIAATTKRLDPSRFGDFPKASLEATVDASGKLLPAWSATGRVALAPSSTVRGTSVSGEVSGAFAQERVRDVVADLRVGGAVLRARGSLGSPGDRLQVALDAERVETLAALVGPAWPKELAGAVHATGHLEGAFAALGGSVNARVQRFTAPGVTIADGTLHAAVPPAGTAAAAREWRTRPVTLDARLGGLRVAGSTYSRASIDFAGTLAAHTATLAAVGPDVDATAQLRGGVTEQRSGGATQLVWSGTVLSLENRGTYAVRLLAPAQLEASAGRVALQDARLAVADGNLRVGTFVWTQGRITSEGDFTGIPVAALARLAGTTLPMRSTLVIGGDWNVSATPRLNGTVRVRRQSGDVYAGTAQALEAGEIALGISQLELDATLRNDAVDARASLRAARIGTLQATAAIAANGGAGRIGASSPITATVKGELTSLRPLQPFIGTAAIVDGALTLDVAVSGTLGQPVSTGSITARNLRVDAPKYGINWHDGRGRASLGRSIVTLEDVSFASGDGRFAIAGTIPLAALTRDPMRAASQAAHLRWQAENFRATNRPDLMLVISGGGTVGMAQGRLALAGDVRVDEGRIEFERTPGATLSSDVVIAGQPRREERRSFEDLPLALDMRVDLGRRLRISGQGLRATLQGEARLTTATTGALRARGTLRTVDGTYFAFGQQLTIDRGRLMFDGPLDNPGLDIVALRKNLPVEAGVHLSGTAKLPQLRLTSNPPVPDGEKLSWLVLGQGLERSSGADLAALQAAAGALFGSGGPGIGTRIAQRVGLDDLSLRSSGGGSGGVQGQVLAFSKRLTNRLYVTFEQGLAAVNSALRVDFTLTRSLTLRARAGQVSSLGIYFVRSFE